MKASWILALVAASPMVLALGQEPSTGTELVDRAVKKKVLTFDCDRMPEVCHNMCYGMTQLYDIYPFLFHPERTYPNFFFVNSHKLQEPA